MIAIDTHILARFDCDDPQDPEAARQRPLARKVIVDSPAPFVPLTVVPEPQWVMRAFCQAVPDGFCEVIDHLLGLAHVTVLRWEVVKEAADLHRKGLDFADALHWACSRHCEFFVSFDDRRLARRAKRLGLAPAVVLPR